MKYQKLFSPITVGGVTLKNRFAMAPMGPLGLADADGGWNQRGIDYYTERAKGGTGLIITGVTFFDQYVEKQDPSTVPNPLYKPVQFVKTSREMTERVHAYGSKIFLQLSAGFGRVTIPTNVGDIPPIAPSEIPHRWLDKTCRAITVDEIHLIIKQFGDAAFHAKRAGFDGVQIHAVHEGYLMDQFAISMFNHRTDEYGGSLENRLRFAKEVVEVIKKRCGADFLTVTPGVRFAGGEKSGNRPVVERAQRPCLRVDRDAARRHHHLGMHRRGVPRGRAHGFGDRGDGASESIERKSVDRAVPLSDFLLQGAEGNFHGRGKRFERVELAHHATGDEFGDVDRVENDRLRMSDRARVGDRYGFVARGDDAEDAVHALDVGPELVHEALARAARHPNALRGGAEAVEVPDEADSLFERARVGQAVDVLHVEQVGSGLCGVLAVRQKSSTPQSAQSTAY